MSTTEKLPPSADETLDPPPAAESQPTGSARWTRRRYRMIVAVVVLAAVVASCIVAFGSGGGGYGTSGVGSAKAISRTAPLTLPAQVQGLNPLPDKADPTKIQRWKDRAGAAARGATLVAQGYGTARVGRTLRVVAARTDLTGQLELAWAMDAGHAVGDDRCTQNLRLVPRGTVAVRPTVMLCWRITGTLTAYTVIIDPQHMVAESEGVAALDQVWKSISNG